MAHYELQQKTPKRGLFTSTLVTGCQTAHQRVGARLYGNRAPPRNVLGTIDLRTDPGACSRRVCRTGTPRHCFHRVVGHGIGHRAGHGRNDFLQKGRHVREGPHHLGRTINITQRRGTDFPGFSRRPAARSIPCTDPTATHRRRSFVRLAPVAALRAHIIIRLPPAHHLQFEFPPKLGRIG